MARGYWNRGRPNHGQNPTYRQLARENAALRHSVHSKQQEIATLIREKADLTRSAQAYYGHVEELQVERKSLKRDVRKLNEELDVVEDERHKLDARYHELVDVHRELKNQIQQNTKAGIDLQTHHRELVAANEADQKTMEVLKEQVIQYKGMISASTRQEEQTPDDVINGKAAQIFFSIQNFVVQNFRGVQLNYAALPESVRLWMQEFMPNAQQLVSPPRAMIIIGIICKTLTHRFNAEFCFGLSDDTHVKAAAKLAKLEPGDYPETKQWIDVTRRLIAQSDETVLERAESSMHYVTQDEIMMNLQAALPIDWTPSVQCGLGKIIASTIQLFRLLQRQAASFHVQMMQVSVDKGPNLRFNPRTMEDVGNEMEDDGQDWVVGLAVFPGIFKWGDERGENAENMTVVSRAKVVAQKSPQGAVQEKKRGHGGRAAAITID